MKAGTTVQATKRQADEESDEDGNPPEQTGSGSGHNFIWWTLGGMAVLAVTLAVVFNTKN